MLVTLFHVVMLESTDKKKVKKDKDLLNLDKTVSVESEEWFHGTISKSDVRLLQFGHQIFLLFQLIGIFALPTTKRFRNYLINSVFVSIVACLFIVCNCCCSSVVVDDDQ